MIQKMHRSTSILQRQRLSIDPYYNRNTADGYEASSSTSSSSPPFSMSPHNDSWSKTAQTPISPDLSWRFFALCLYDFSSQDPDHLPFGKNELLEIVKKEESGWWAALRDNRIGWIPSAFVTPLSDELAATLRDMPEDHRVDEYEAVKLYGSTPVIGSFHSHRATSLSSEATYSQPLYVQDDDWVPIAETGGKMSFTHARSFSGLLTTDFPHDVVPPLCGGKLHSPPRQAHPSLLDGYSSSESEAESASDQGSCSCSSQSAQQGASCPPSPATPMPHPLMPKIEPLCINKPSAPTLSSRFPSPSPIRSPLFRSRSDSTPLSRTSARKARRQPIILNDHSSLSRLSVYIDTKVSAEVDIQTMPVPYRLHDARYDSSDEEGVSPTSRRADKVKQLTGDDDAQAFHNAKQAQANLPWYLQPSYTSTDIKMEYDGSVRAGTLTALVERLTVDPLKLMQENLYRHAFLATYHTFTTPVELFDLLIERYQMDHPSDLSQDEFQEWKERKLRPVQKRVLAILTIWLDQHAMILDEPGLASRLKEFLHLIQSPPSLALTAKHILQSLSRKLSAATLPRTQSASALPSKSRKQSRGHKNDLVRLDALEFAQQLTLYEHQLYIKVREKECIIWSKTQTSESVSNLSSFCSTHDRIAAWVKSSILSNEGLGKRADTIDFWIRVAEKCRSLNNFSSLTAIVAALSSAVITRLQFTWADVSRGTHLQPLARINEPTSNFQTYRALLQSINGPCIPYIGIFLTDIVHVQDQMKDFVTIPSTTPSSPTTVTNLFSILPPSSSEPATDPNLINFVKRLRLYAAIDAIVRFQSKTYNIIENTSMSNFIVEQLAINAARDESIFWTKSQEIQQNEVARVDIRKGLEAAGF